MMDKPLDRAIWRQKGISAGGLINVLAAAAAHLPCCGPQVVLGIFGMQALGIFSTTYLYRYQYLMPLLIALLLTAILMAWGWRRRCQRTFCEHVKAADNPKTRIGNFFIINLVIGYAVLGGLYLLVPPHRHHVIDTHTIGYLDPGSSRVSVPYRDDKRSWPWSKRVFTGSAADQRAPASERLWYDFWSEQISSDARIVPVHLYARPAGGWPASGGQAAGSLRYYVSVESSKESILAEIDRLPALLLFYSRNCAPCRKEMDALSGYREVVGNGHIAIVSLTAPEPTFARKAEEERVQLINVSALDAQDVIAAFNDRPLALPFSLALDAEGRVCAGRAGLLGMERLKKWRLQCWQ